MLERFDRVQSENGYFRLGLVSGLTIIGCDDGYGDRANWSYPLLSDNLRRWSTNAKADCAELFRRIVFNAAVTNNDDHPRNHALIRGSNGWRLSPAYDLVPTRMISTERRDLALTVGLHGRMASVINLMSSVGSFGLRTEDAHAIIDSVVQGVKQWREVYSSCGVTGKDIEYIAPAMLPACFFSPATDLA